MFSFFIQLLIGSTAVLVVALSVSPMLRRQSAAMRHALLGSVAVALVMLPFVIPFLPTITPIANTTANVTETPKPNPSLLTPAEPVLEPVVMPQYVAMPENEVQRAGSETQRNFRATPNDPVLTLFTPAVLLYCTLLCGTVIRLVMLLASLVTMRNLVRNAIPFELPHGLTTAELCRTFHIRRNVRMLTVPQVEVPFAANIFRPVIFLPESMRDADSNRLRLVLMHEMAHIARCDVFWQLLTRVMLAVYWFHPMAYLLAMQIRREREFACDDAVLLKRENPEDYASVLLDISKLIRRQTVWHPGCAVAMAQTHRVEQRIRAILDLKRPRKPLGRLTGLLLILVACGMTAFAGMFSPFEQEQKSPEPVKTEEATAIKSENPEASLTPRGAVIPPVQEGTAVPVAADDPFIMFDTILVELNKDAPDKSLSRLISEKINRRMDETTGQAFSMSKESVKDLFDTLQKEKKITILSAPRIMAAEKQMAVIWVGSNKEKNIVMAIAPRVAGDRIFADITLKKDVDDKLNTKTFECGTLAVLQENVPLFVSGLTMKSADGEAGNEVMFCVTATIVPPKKEVKTERTVSFTGHVFMPDGTPVKNAMVWFRHVELQDIKNFFPGIPSSKVLFEGEGLCYPTDKTGEYAQPISIVGTPVRIIGYVSLELLPENSKLSSFVTEPVIFEPPYNDVLKHDFTLTEASP
ncbi:MAG: M56 family metallopeptidase, partial [Planctomycetaceae bacterium]|nr:M56 family metallopeptidase [Planctomycetaceae bacterium]